MRGGRAKLGSGSSGWPLQPDTKPPQYVSRSGLFCLHLAISKGNRTPLRIGVRDRSICRTYEQPDRTSAPHRHRIDPSFLSRSLGLPRRSNGDTGKHSTSLRGRVSWNRPAGGGGERDLKRRPTRPGSNAGLQRKRDPRGARTALRFAPGACAAKYQPSSDRPAGTNLWCYASLTDPPGTVRPAGAFTGDQPRY